MKRSTLLAVITGAVLVGGGVYAVTRTTSSRSSSPSSTATRPSTPPAATPALPTATPSEGSAASTAASQGSASTAPSPSGSTAPAPASTLDNKDGRSEQERAAIEEAARIGGAERTGQNAIRKPTPQATDETPAQRQRRMTRTIELTACQAPDAEARLAAMPAEEGRRFQERCAAVGVTLRTR